MIPHASRGTRDSFGMRPMTASLVLLVRNEIEGLRVIFPKTPFGSVDEIVAIDGHSTDDSVEYLAVEGDQGHQATETWKRKCHDGRR